ncbi:MAG: hypothetical protein ACI81W_004046, partial [Saprospiraceae bacterium]
LCSFGLSPKEPKTQGLKTRFSSFDALHQARPILKQFNPGHPLL